MNDYTKVLIRSNVGLEEISFEEVDDNIFYLSTSILGGIYNGKSTTWGINKNTLSPSLTRVQGTLPKGTYQVNFTYLSKYGLESGAGVASVITVPDNSGISLSIPSIHINPDVVGARVYCSSSDGTELYFITRLILGDSYTISSVDNTRPFRHFNLDAPPKGSIVRFYRGRLYVASGNILYYSEPFAYNHFDIGYNYIEFPNTIDEVLPVEDGLWVCSDRIYYLTGDSPDNFKRIVKEYIKVVKGTATRFSGSYLHLDNTPVGYKWLVTTDLGILALFNQGLIINLTASNLSVVRADKGASIFLQSNGNNQYISILKQNDKSNNSVMGDMVEATIVRNGVIIT
jgi:hypothetical protein